MILWKTQTPHIKPGFHIVVSDGDVPASTGTWRWCISDVIKSWTELNFSHLDWDIDDITGTSVTSPKKCSHIIVSIPAASPIHWQGRVPLTITLNKFYDSPVNRNGSAQSKPVWTKDPIVKQNCVYLSPVDTDLSDSYPRSVSNGSI